MKKHILFIIATYCIIINTNAQFCNSKSGKCYQENTYFSDSQIYMHDYKYATVHNIYKSSSASVDLYMTVYSPYNLLVDINNADTFKCKQCKRPFILLIHGGGFRGGCRTGLNNECKEFAKRGYVAATIDYRLGWVPGDEKQICNANFCMTQDCVKPQDDSCKVAYKDSVSFAQYRAFQDASAALRFITHYADNLNIDRNYFYLDGHSAGSIIATNTTYMSQDELNRLFPAANTILGAVNSSGNTFTDAYKIAGLFNNWGSLNDTLCISGNKDKIPMIAFHGIDDNVVPFSKGYPIGCSNGAYQVCYGSYLLYKRLANIYPDLPVELYACFGGHGIFNDNPETDLKTLYRIQKAVCFFNRIRSGDKTRKYIRINKNEIDITYQQLDSISPVKCMIAGFFNNSSVSNISSYKNSGISKTGNLNDFNIYPNPSVLQATLINPAGTEINIMLEDLNGKILWTKEHVTQRTVDLPITTLTNGLYLVIIKNDENLKVIKLIKSD